MQLGENLTETCKLAKIIHFIRKSVFFFHPFLKKDCIIEERQTDTQTDKQTSQL